MNRRNTRPAPTEAERETAWNAWLDGDSPSRIHEYDLPDHSLAVVRSILQGEPPERLRQDVRYLHQGRYLWVSANGIANTRTGKDDAFVVVRSPRTYTSETFQKAMRGVRRMVREDVPGADLNLAVIEGFDEAHAGPTFIDKHGCLGFAFDAEGKVTRILPARDVVDEADEAPVPGP